MKVTEMEHLATLASMSKYPFMVEQMEKAVKQYKVTPTDEILQEIRFTSQMFILKQIVSEIGLAEAIKSFKRLSEKDQHFGGFVMPSVN